jgi:hypothetical protein
LTFAASGEGGLAGAFKQVGGLIGGLITPATAAIAATVALGAAAAAAAIQYDKLQVSSQRAVSGAGARTGTTTSDINAFVDKNTPSAFSGATLSQKESRALAEGLTQTGDIVISKLQSMSAAVVGFSNQTGQSMDESVKAFAKMGADPVKRLDELAGAFGPFSQNTRTLVQDMVAAGDKTLAWNAILSELGTTAKGTAGNLTTAEMAGRGLVNVLQTASKPSGLEKQLDDVRQKLNGAIEAANNLPKHGVEAPPEVSNSIVALSKQFEALYARQQAVMGLKASSTFDDLADKARVATEALIPQTRQIEQLTLKIRELERAKSGGAASNYGADVDGAALQAAQNQLALLKQSQDEAARYNQQVAGISQSWGNVGQTVALTLQAMQNQLPVVQAVTASAQMRAQAEATYNSLLNQGKTAIEAEAIAAKQLETSQAAATAGVKKQVEALDDATDMVKATANGTEAATAAAIAYKNAMEAGASATAAAALSAATLENNLAKAAVATAQQQVSDMQQANTQNGGARYNSAGALVGISNAWGSDWHGTGGTSSWDPGGFFGNLAPNRTAGTSQGITAAVNSAIANGGIDAAISALKNTKGYAGTIGGPIIASEAAIPVDYSALFSQADALYALKNGQTTDKTVQAANLNDELAFVHSAPETVARDQKINDLMNAIKSLTTSTDSLNGTNQDLLSPYYTQDPRTSHIGFRSQGMATGGELTVPGGYSANDNMLAQIPVASGEIVSVRRPGQNLSGGSSNITINLGGLTVNSGGPADTNAIGRTVYQAMQNATRQLQAAGR